MPFDKEFQHHLHEVMVAASLQVRDEVEQHKRELIFKAQQTHNGGAIPIAYSNAAIYAFKTRTQRVIDGYFQALNDCGIQIDADVERELLKMIGSLTSARHPLTFPPGLQGQQLTAVQGAHAREKMRVGNQLHREAANRLRAAKLKNDKTAKFGSFKPQQALNEQTKMPSNSEAGQTFISYAQESQEHKDWILAFATTLRQHGVDVVLDEWHLPLGGDMYHFMEKSVRSARFVIVVCTPAYAAKANDRRGGVGYEATIITTELAQQMDQIKFIPILRSGEYRSAAPVWLASRRSLDFTATPYSEAEFELLLRTLHGKEVQAPTLGPKPAFESTPSPGLSISVPKSAPPSLSIPASGNLVVNPTRRLALGDEINDTERELLDAAVKDSSGQINHRRPIGSDQLLANGRNFIEPGNPRSSARWLGALESLEHKGLIRATSYAKDFYAVTDAGFTLAEQLGPFVRWTTSEVQLQAFYFGTHEPESMTLRCSGLIEIPPVYYEDQYGADGTLMRSLKQRRSLLVEGIDPQTLDSLKFKPTDLHFDDAVTQAKHQFRVACHTSPDRRTLLLEIQD